MVTTVWKRLLAQLGPARTIDSSMDAYHVVSIVMSAAELNAMEVTIPKDFEDLHALLLPMNGRGRHEDAFAHEWEMP